MTPLSSILGKFAIIPALYLILGAVILVQTFFLDEATKALSSCQTSLGLYQRAGDPVPSKHGHNIPRSTLNSPARHHIILGDVWRLLFS
jgi:hypothetical protein